MGAESTLRAFGGERDVKMLMTGKRTAVYNMKLSEVQQKIPTLSFSPNTVDKHDVADYQWDYGGRMGSRPLFSHFAFGSDAVLWVVDCADKNTRLTLPMWQVISVLRAGKRKAVLCVLLENTDAKDALSEEEVVKILQMKETDLYKLFPVDLADTSSLEKPAAWVCETLHSKPEELEQQKIRSKFSFIIDIVSSLRKLISA